MIETKKLYKYTAQLMRKLDLQLLMQSVPLTTKVLRVPILLMARCTRYSII